MARQVHPVPDDTTSAHRSPDKGVLEIDLVQRWVEAPDGSMELLNLPLTPELFLDGQMDDKVIQHPIHHLTVHLLFIKIHRHMASEPDAIVLSDAKHLLGPGLPGPGPDISVVRGLKERDFECFDLAEQGVAPCLIVEVLSPTNARIREVDEVEKMALYEQAGVAEYILVDLRKDGRSFRFGLRGFRLGADQRYRPMEPDGQGRLRSETTGLLFAVSPERDGIDLFNVRMGERLLTSQEEAERRKLAEQEARAERERRKALEAELERLRAELGRRETSGTSDTVKK